MGSLMICAEGASAPHYLANLAIYFIRIARAVC